MQKTKKKIRKVMKTSTLIYKYIALQIFRPKKTSIFILYFLFVRSQKFIKYIIQPLKLFFLFKNRTKLLSFGILIEK